MKINTDIDIKSFLALVTDLSFSNLSILKGQSVKNSKGENYFFDYLLKIFKKMCKNHKGKDGEILNKIRAKLIELNGENHRYPGKMKIRKFIQSSTTCINNNYARQQKSLNFLTSTDSFFFQDEKTPSIESNKTPLEIKENEKTAPPSFKERDSQQTVLPSPKQQQPEEPLHPSSKDRETNLPTVPLNPSIEVNLPVEVNPSSKENPSLNKPIKLTLDPFDRVNPGLIKIQKGKNKRASCPNWMIIATGLGTFALSVFSLFYLKSVHNQIYLDNNLSTCDSPENLILNSKQLKTYCLLKNRSKKDSELLIFFEKIFLDFEEMHKNKEDTFLESTKKTHGQWKEKFENQTLTFNQSLSAYRNEWDHNLYQLDQNLLELNGSSGWKDPLIHQQIEDWLPYEKLACVKTCKKQQLILETATHLVKDKEFNQKSLNLTIEIISHYLENGYTKEQAQAINLIFSLYKRGDFFNEENFSLEKFIPDLKKIDIANLDLLENLIKNNLPSKIFKRYVESLNPLVYEQFFDRLISTLASQGEIKTCLNSIENLLKSGKEKKRALDVLNQLLLNSNVALTEEVQMRINEIINEISLEISYSHVDFHRTFELLAVSNSSQLVDIGMGWIKAPSEFVQASGIDLLYEHDQHISQNQKITISKIYEGFLNNCVTIKSKNIEKILKTICPIKENSISLSKKTLEYLADNFTPYECDLLGKCLLQTPQIDSWIEILLSKKTINDLPWRLFVDSYLSLSDKSKHEIGLDLLKILIKSNDELIQQNAINLIKKINLEYLADNFTPYECDLVGKCLLQTPQIDSWIEILLNKKTINDLPWRLFAHSYLSLSDKSKHEIGLNLLHILVKSKFENYEPLDDAWDLQDIHAD